MLKSSSSVQILSIGFSKNSKSGETILKQKWMLLQEKFGLSWPLVVSQRPHLQEQRTSHCWDESLEAEFTSAKNHEIDGTPIGQIKSLRTRSSEDVKQGHQVKN